MKRFFLDANVIFTAAHNFDGNGRALFRLAAAHRLELVSSRYAVEEAARNIALKLPGCVTQFNGLIASLLLVAEPSEAEIQRAAAHGLPYKDRPILAAASRGKATALVTGDRRDFGHLYGRTIEGMAMMTPADAVADALSSLAKRK